jgi:hypothetical protein
MGLRPESPAQWPIRPHVFITMADIVHTIDHFHITCTAASPNAQNRVVRSQSQQVDLARTRAANLPGNRQSYSTVTLNSTTLTNSS